MNETVLEPIYFQPGFRIRCTVQAHFKSANENQHEAMLIFKSNYVEITDNLDHKSNQTDSKMCTQIWKEKNSANKLNYTETSSLPFYYSRKSLHHPKLLKNNLKFDKPFLAKADYISAEYLATNPKLDTSYLNYIQLSIDVPFIDGMIPLISTKQLYNYRYLLSDQNYSSNHLCSNFIKNKTSFIKYGFMKSADTNKNNLFESYRNSKTLDFYSNLDKDNCNWKFTGYFDISELTTHCQAQIISDPDIRDYQSEKSYLVIKIPLHVSYVYASAQATWSSIEYKTQLEVSIIYRSSPISINNQVIDKDISIKQFPFRNDENIVDFFKLKQSELNSFNFNKNDLLMSLKVSKISMTHDGRLVLEFTTIPSFYGLFIFF